MYTICYISHLALKLFLEMSSLFRYLHLEEALSLELSIVSSSQEVFSSQYRDRNLWGSWLHGRNSGIISGISKTILGQSGLK